MPYNQFPQAIGDLVAGVNTYQFITILPVVQLIKTGKLRALAVTGNETRPGAARRADHHRGRLSGSSRARIGPASW